MSKMDLSKLYPLQKLLMERIDYNEKDRFDKTVLALLVEVGECANEWRGFKYWSQNQKPNVECKKCYGTGCCHYFGQADNYTPCEDCGGYPQSKNPLLEEYVDGLHFVLQLGIELGYEHVKPYSLIQIDTLDVFRIVYKAIVDVSIHRDKGSYERLLCEYLSLGYHLGFKDDDILIAYIVKNDTNHERQNNGY
jgi:dimeric dUTPase (all-alpha-NTP-PPase superfamily)